AVERGDGALFIDLNHDGSGRRHLSSPRLLHHEIALRAAFERRVRERLPASLAGRMHSAEFRPRFADRAQSCHFIGVKVRRVEAHARFHRLDNRLDQRSEPQIVARRKRAPLRKRFEQALAVRRGLGQPLDPLALRRVERFFHQLDRRLAQTFRVARDGDQPASELGDSIHAASVASACCARSEAGNRWLTAACLWNRSISRAIASRPESGAPPTEYPSTLSISSSYSLSITACDEG